MKREELTASFLREIETLREELIESTSRILQFETISGAADPAGQARCRQQIEGCAAWLRELTARMGFRWIESAPAGRWFAIEWPAASRAARPQIGVPTHIDVVPVGEGWTHPPFSGAVAEGFIWGRGAQDDKGPLIAALYGLYALKRAGFRPPVTYRIIIGTQEEIGDWSDLREYLDQQGAPDFGFTPDASFPLITGEKGMVNATFEAAWGAETVAAESVEFISLRGGSRPNIVPDLCELTLRYTAARRAEITRELMDNATRFVMEHPEARITIFPEKARSIPGGAEELVISFLGKPAHGSTPEKGHNAILDALQFFALQSAFPARARRFAGFLAWATAALDGENLGIRSSHDFVGHTTVNLGVAELGPEGATAIVNVRPTLGLERETVVQRAAETAARFAEETGLRLRVFARTPGSNALFLDPKTAGPFLRGLQEGFERVAGRPAELRSIGGTTYAKAMPNCCAFGPVMSDEGEEELAHQKDERVSLEAQVRNARIYGLGLDFAGLNLKS